MGLSAESTPFGSGHFTFIGGGLTIPSLWDSIDENESYLVI